MLLVIHMRRVQNIRLHLSFDREDHLVHIYILNVDASAQSNPITTSFGGLIRDSYGGFIRGFHGNIGYSNILHA